MVTNTPKSQHKPRPAQEAQMCWVGGFRHHRPSQDEDNALQFVFGAPRVDHIEDEADLLENNNRRAAFLLYRRADFQD